MPTTKATLALLLPLGIAFGCSGDVSALDPALNTDSSGTASGTPTPGAPAATDPVTGLPITPAGSNTASVPPGTPVLDPSTGLPVVDPSTGLPVVTPPTSTDASGTATVDPTAPAGTNEPPAPTGVAIPLQLKGEPIHARFVRLTHSQWENTVQQVLALEGPTGLVAGFPEDAVVGTYSNDENLLYVTQGLYSDYEAAAEVLAEQVTGDSANLSRIYAGTDAAGFINAFGRSVYRRPLSAEEVQNYQVVYDTGAGLSGAETAFQKGARLVIQTMLQSAFFLYRVELGAEGTPLDSYEVAAKLSFALADVGPSVALLDAAGRGELDTPEGLSAAATSLLEEPSAVPVMRTFHGETFAFTRYLNIDKEPGSVQNYTPELNADLQEASYLFFDRIFQSFGVADIFTAATAYVNSRMAPLYGVTAPAEGFAEVELGAERKGYFTQVPFLILNSTNEIPDAIHRGVDLNLRALCVEPGVPAPDVMLVAPPPGGTTRQRVEISTSPAGCAICHTNYINPLGFAFENFDGMGQVRDMDNGNPIDTSSAYPFTEGTYAFANSAELMQRMASAEQAHGCYAKHLMEFMLARQVTEEDRATIEALKATSLANGSIKSMIAELVASPEFRTRIGAAQ